jgi:HlyD family secretion protein
MKSATAPVPIVASGVMTKKKSRAKWYIIVGILVVVALGVAAKVAAGKKQKGLVVTVEPAVVKTITQLVNATGKVQPELEVKISPEVSGEIIELPLREGARVQKGDLLVKIKADNYKYQVEQQEANLTASKASAVQAKSQLIKAQEDFKRTEGLFSSTLISDSDYTASKTTLEVAQANYDNALAQIRRNDGLLNQSRDLLSKTTIYSPADGTISSLNSEVGERVVATGSFTGTEIMRVADLSNMEVRVNVNENDVVNVKVGDTARISVDAYPSRKFVGKVKEIGATAKTQGLSTQEEVTNFLVKIRVTDKDISLRPGMSANVDIETMTVENVVAVPIQAVTVRSRVGNKTLEQLTTARDMKAKETQGDGAAAAVNEKQQRERERDDRAALQRVVFVRNGSKVKMVPVETGIGDTSHMEIKSGIKAGEEVVSGPFSVITRTLADGSDIRIEPPKGQGKDGKDKKDSEKK